MPTLDFPDPVRTVDIPPAPPPAGIFEMTLEVADLAAAERFYVDVLGFEVIERWGDDRPAVWVRVGNEGFLGLWSVEAGGEKAIHHGRGGSHVHYAIRVPKGTLTTMEERLKALGYDVERYDFENGNQSIYVDDPDGNVVEFAEWRTLWDGRPNSV
jgi:catechol 2,3-dioxygenase-like lactoylglutathione lyase family enzyme